MNWLACLMMIAAAQNSPTNASSRLADWTIRTLSPPRQRSLLRFAEQEIVVPTGDRRGAWRADTQPWTRCLFNEMDSGHWPTVVTTGPSQSGKTQSCFAIPTIYTIAELAENFVLGVPDGDMADKKWRTDLLPILQSSPRLRSLIPTEGAGSRGGKVRDTIQFTNGVIAAIMSRGARDAGKAGFTARVVHVTEAADWSNSAETSEEADPLRQLRARQRSYTRRRRRMLVEGTVKIAEWLPWKLKGEDGEPLISSMSQLLTPCPHCGGWISPEREHFVGWQGAASEDEACNEATFICPECSSMLSDEDRRKANRDIRLLHYGQTIDEQGEIHGELPPVSTLWFRYSQWHNLLIEPSDLAEDEWKASQLPEGTQDRDDAERELCQFQWCIPFVSTLTKHEPLKASSVCKKATGWPRNELPDDTVGVTAGIDIGDWKAHWAVIAWRQSGQRHVCAHGWIKVKRSKRDELSTRIRAALHEFADEIGERGFLKRGSTTRILPDRVWIDGGYMPDSVAKFVRDRGGKNSRYRMCRGRGKSQTHGSKSQYLQITRRSTAHPTCGLQWSSEPNYDRRILEYTFNADYYKINVHEGLRASPEALGAISLFTSTDPREHVEFVNHLLNEQLKRVWEAGKGFADVWDQKGQNHWLDAMAMASVAGDEAGISPQIAAAYRPPAEHQPPAADDPDPPAPASNFYAELTNR